MKNKKVFIFFLLSILLVSNNNIAHSQTYNHNNWTYQNDNNSQQAFALIDAIKSNVFNNDFKSARKDFIELIKQVDASSLRAEDKLKYFNIVNEVTSRYFYSEKDISKRQRAVLEIKNIYKELFLYDSRFQDSYINSIQAFIAINNNSNTALYGVLDLIDIYLNSIQNKDDSKLDDLFKIYDTYNDNLITNSIFKASIHNRLKKTVDLFTHLAESDFPALNTRYLPYLSMSLSYLGNFYLINATTDDAKKLYDKAFDTAKILSPNSPNFYEQLDVLDMSLERLSWKYLESNSILKRNELNIKVWNYYYFLLKNNYLKVANLHNYTKFMQDASFYYYKNSQYDDYSNLYNFIRNLTDNITEEQLRANNISGFNENFGLYGLESIYKELVQQGKIQPYKTTDIASTPEHSLSNVEISTETAIKYEKESSQYADGRKATESLKKAAYVYSELNKSERGKYDEKLAAIYVVIARESSTLNDNDFLNYSQKAVQLIEKNKETTSDYNLQSLAYVYMRLGEYYMKKKNCSVAENYLNKSVDAARYTLKNRKVDSNLAHSLLMPY